jgi:hypothetical protein
MATATIDREQWCSRKTAAKMLSIGITIVPRVAPRMGIRTRLIPGRKGYLFSVPDIRRALAELEAKEAAEVALATSGTNAVDQAGRIGRPAIQRETTRRTAI